MEKTLQANITDTFNELDNILFAFDDEQFNQIPFEGSWTAGQVAEHIIKSLEGLPKLMSAPAIKTDRDPGEKIQAIEKLFLDYTVKFTSPDFILPTGKGHRKEQQLEQLDQLKTHALTAVNNDLSLLCTVAELPTFGQLTRLEWIHFFLVHTQRHTQQLKNIFNKLKQTA